MPSRIDQGTWLASQVELDGGGVTVSELVDGPLGWAEAPCASTTSPAWYFASGSTSAGSSLYVFLFNPTSTEAVVDLTFATGQGVTKPQPFEDLVVAPGALVVVGVASYVQDQSSVATIVAGRFGAGGGRGTGGASMPAGCRVSRCDSDRRCPSRAGPCPARST